MDHQDVIAANKTKDATTVIAAVQALFTMLSTIVANANKDSHAITRFRQQMSNAQSQVSDPSVIRFVETTLGSLSTVGAKDVPNKEDIQSLRLLLSLLRSQLMQFVETVKADHKAEADLWDTQRVQLQTQLQLLRKEIAALTTSVKKAKNIVRTTSKTISIQKALLNGTTMAEYKLIQEQIVTATRDCTTTATEFKRLKHNRKVAEKLVADLDNLAFSKEDNDILDTIFHDVKLPPLNKVDPTGKRCCVFCDRVRKNHKPCGDKCIRNDETCPAETLEGCACLAPSKN